VNSRALELANITSAAPDPSGGIVQRDNEHEPTGILFENAAMNLVKSIIPKSTQDERSLRYRQLFNKLFEAGLVCVHDFDGLDSWDTLLKCHRDAELRLRVRKTIPLAHLEAFIDSGMHTNWGDEKLNIGCVKLFADGALGPQTAAMKHPYEGSDNKGFLLLTENEIFEIGEFAGQNGIALAVHAIGDRANHVVLNAFEKLKSLANQHRLPHLKHRIEHVQIIDPGDLPRMAKLNITASVQPIHAPSDMEISDKYLGSRSKNAYAFRRMLENNIDCVFGSDAPVESFHPFKGIHAVITRQRLDGSPSDDGWHPNQRLSLDEALECYTTKPSKFIQKGSYLGRIAQGYKADFIILDQNPFEIKPHQMANIKPAATFIDGVCVFQSSSLPMDFQVSGEF
jgi:predicted amidohydrolase YtcJ